MVPNKCLCSMAKHDWRQLDELDGAQTSLEAVRWQLPDIDRQSVPQTDCMRKKRLTVGVSTVFVLHWICMYFVSDPLVQIGTGCGYSVAGMMTSSLWMQYSIRTLLWARRRWIDSHFSFCNMAETLQGAVKKTPLPYKNLIIFRIIQYFLVNFSVIICEAFCH